MFIEYAVKGLLALLMAIVYGVILVGIIIGICWLGFVYPWVFTVFTFLAAWAFASWLKYDYDNFIRNRGK